MDNRREHSSRRHLQEEQPTPSSTLPLPECPISYEEITALEHPVFCRDGGIYEKAQIEAWLAARGKSPLDHNLQLTPADIHQSHVLVDFINCYNQLAQKYAVAINENNKLTRSRNELADSLDRAGQLIKRQEEQIQEVSLRPERTRRQQEMIGLHDLSLETARWRNDNERRQALPNEKFSRKRVYPRSFIGKKKPKADEEGVMQVIRDRCCPA